MIFQTTVTIPERPRGFHLITREVLAAAGKLPSTGLIHVFIQHTSAGLTINENADRTVRLDFESVFNRLVSENEFYAHGSEGPDDMPAHIKASLTGSSVTIPVSNGEPALGTWQGIYLCEFRNHGGPRSLVITVMGE